MHVLSYSYSVNSPTTDFSHPPSSRHSSIHIPPLVVWSAIPTPYPLHIFTSNSFPSVQYMYKYMYHTHPCIYISMKMKQIIIECMIRTCTIFKLISTHVHLIISLSVIFYHYSVPIILKSDGRTFIKKSGAIFCSCHLIPMISTKSEYFK